MDDKDKVEQIINVILIEDSKLEDLIRSDNPITEIVCDTETIHSNFARVILGKNYTNVGNAAGYHIKNYLVFLRDNQDLIEQIKRCAILM